MYYKNSCPYYETTEECCVLTKRNNINSTAYALNIKIFSRPTHTNKTKSFRLYSCNFCVLLGNGHITLNIPVLVRSLKSSNVEPG